MTRVNDLDLELLRALNEDASKSYREIGEKIGAVKGRSTIG
ncbi:MAG: AsnC family protein [Candidatus Syntropharchaeales archaeon]